MIPNVLFLIEQLPLTPNGKMNRKAMEQFYMDHKKNKRRRSPRKKKKKKKKKINK